MWRLQVTSGCAPVTDPDALLLRLLRRLELIFPEPLSSLQDREGKPFAGVQPERQEGLFDRNTSWSSRKYYETP